MGVPPKPVMAHRKSNARQPLMRPPPSRAQTATPTQNGRASPADSTTTTVPTKSPARSVAGSNKRKERDFDKDGDEETNINVVVRCRGRNDREVRENSGVVVSTSGVKGNKVDLSMGASALSNKTYSFDKVFSPAADQEMLFNEVVSPILDEVLEGFNCTIFAYGQTGTGKTYTMSGDITDMRPLPEAAGIIPRVLSSLFDRLGEHDAESSVKCSFIELYNEELRDLLALDESTKLKIYDDNSKKGQTATLVQGMEEAHIRSASKGLELLRNGSHKRQVAATKCNDLSSRSHTVFTITVYMKKTSETGEDFVSAGKLNLVDLAGSENIQRSGAENKRAAEAGLINKSLLTLGRVINALVERSTHIPYRESKLTRLLQDSLGGRTKTCIIATLSPAKSNLEETISTLDYAFRAKNIKNKPQANALVSKKTMLKEFTSEIEKLKAELMATRQRNGVYLTQEAFEEVTTESESRRILSEEQRDKIELMEASLRNKVQELFTLTNNFNSLKKDGESMKIALSGTQGILEKTELVLSHTKKCLAEEEFVRKSHQATELQLLDIGNDLLGTVNTTTHDIRGLHSKLRRRSDLHRSNKMAWTARREDAVHSTTSLDSRIEMLRCQQEGLLEALTNRMNAFVSDELHELEQSQTFLKDKVAAFGQSQAEVNSQTNKAKGDMDTVLSEICTLREDVKVKVGAGMEDLSAAAQRISAGISSELEGFHTQLHGSYASLGRDFKTIFEDVTRQMNEQKSEVSRLQSELSAANQALRDAHERSRCNLIQAMATEREAAASERTELLQQIGQLITTSASKQEQRVQSHVQALTSAADQAEMAHAESQSSYDNGMGAWDASSTALIAQCLSSRDSVKAKIKSDWSLANATTDKIKATTQAVHSQTLDIVNAQMSAMDSQLSSLDEIITRVKASNNDHHAAHTESLAKLGRDVTESYESIGRHMATSNVRTQALADDMSIRASDLSATFPALAEDGEVRTQLSELRHDLQSHDLAEYVPTGTTPAKQVYAFPTNLPRTAPRDDLLDRFHRGAKSPRLTPPSPKRASPSKERSMDIFLDAAPTTAPEHSDPGLDSASPAVTTSTDTTTAVAAATKTDPLPTLSRSSSLRDLDPNRSVAAAQAALSAPPTMMTMMTLESLPPSSQQQRTSGPPAPSGTTTEPVASAAPAVDSTAGQEGGAADSIRDDGSGGVGGINNNNNNKSSVGSRLPTFGRGGVGGVGLVVTGGQAKNNGGHRKRVGAGNGGEKENVAPPSSTTMTMMTMMKMGTAEDNNKNSNNNNKVVELGVPAVVDEVRVVGRRSGRLRGRGSD